MSREDHLRSILATVPDAMIVTDEIGTISSWSATAEQMFGYAATDVIGRNVSMLMPPVQHGDDDNLVFIYLKTGVLQATAGSQNADGKRASGEVFPIELAIGEASIAGERIFTAFIRDLTNRRNTERKLSELQSELIHVSRLSAMGTMASTLAHEINQPLTAIANYLEAARAMIGDTSDGPIGEIADALDLAAAQSLRAGTIVRRLRTFVDGGETEFAAERLDKLVDEATSLALLGAHEAGVVVTMTAVGRDEVMVDRVQIQQVLVNLIRNAIQSMETVANKELKIATSLERAGSVRVTVTDTGLGLDCDIRSRLFEAFATTKEDGMGLGLSICRTIVEAHGGKIWAEASAGGGTAFHFTLPLAGKDDV